MNYDKLKAITQAVSKNVKSEADLYEFRQMLTKYEFRLKVANLRL